MNTIVVVGGPTASGKTALGIEIAKQYGGEIISADSMQIYQGMDIGSAKPTREERQGVPHHLMDVVPPTQNFSVADYAELARAAIADIRRRGRLPVMVGGTGLYIDTVIHHISLPEGTRDEGVRRGLSEFAEAYGKEALHQRLAEADPQSAARLHPNDIKRVVRALEIYETTGVPLSEHMVRSREEPSPYKAVQLGIWHERPVLYERINRRVEEMLAQGLADEVKRCAEMGCTRANTAMQGIGYKEMLDYLDGLCSLAEAEEKIKMETRRYAKRQISWFKRSGIHWLPPGEAVRIEEYAGEE